MRFALGGAFVLAIIFAIIPTRAPEGLEPIAAHKTDLFNLETMSVLIAPESESDLSIDGQNQKVTDGSTLKSQATYKLNNTAELAISSIHGLISFKNQAGFSLKGNEIKIDTGDIYCNFKGNHQGFKITTQYGSIVPVGTKFTVSVRETCVKVHLLAGKLLLTSSKGKEKVISDSTPVFILPGGEFSDKPVSREEAEAQRVPANPGMQMPPASQPEPPKKAPGTILDTL
ncbi:MAG: FecR domain-containing protein [Candidatus Riflebacteria bacterium]|nr:FecR domain-containing protein [Candidatus Riflebacteria bacterium]